MLHGKCNNPNNYVILEMKTMEIGRKFFKHGYSENCSRGWDGGPYIIVFACRVGWGSVVYIFGNFNI